jgi:hypothetical protein
MATTFERHPAPDDDLQFAVDLRGIPRSAYIPLLAAVYAAGLGLYLAVEPTKPWIILAVVALVGLGTDGILRSHPRATLKGPADTAPFLFVPVLFSMAAALFLEEVVHGYWAVPAVGGAAVLLAAALYGEYVSLLSHGPSYALGRFLLNLLTYLTAFAFFAVAYAFDIDLAPSAFAVGLVAMLLAIEVLREAEADAYRALVFAAVIGLVVGEMRWSIYFIPLDGFLAAVFLLLAFYFTTGVIQHYLTGHLNRTVLAEFSIVGVVGLAIIVAGRLLDLG